MNQQPSACGYDSWVIIYNKDKIIGFTSTYKEADDICKKYSNYNWEYAKNVYKNQEKRDKVFNQLNQLTIND